VTWRVGVVVPAHDEVELIGPCLAAILASLAASGLDRADYRVVVVADRCADGTAERAAALLGDHGDVIEIDARNVGAARAAGTAALLARFDGAELSQLWLANTDADSEVPLSWIERQLELAGDGDAVVAGVVTVRSFREHPSWVPERFLARYNAVHGDDGPDEHMHVHGANLGVRADAYAAVGGWASVRDGEDNDLWNRLFAAGWRCRSTRSLAVVTSGRRVGRSGAGFAGYLGRLAAMEP
jgi:cellulose synthase/poly-beta-1,6-N-acetylglucosamine synthase-like glycosyltransferase